MQTDVITKESTKQPHQMDIIFGATDIFFYSKGEDVNRAVYNINIEEPMLSKKKRSHSSLLSYTERL